MQRHNGRFLRWGQLSTSLNFKNRFELNNSFGGDLMCLSHWTAAFQDILSVRRRTWCGLGGGGNIRKRKPSGPPSAGRMRWLATVFVLFSKVRNASWIIFWKKKDNSSRNLIGFYVRKNITAFSSSSSQENKHTSKYVRIHVGINWVCLKSNLSFFYGYIAFSV